MAISGDAPVSADNLKAVVDKLMGGGYLPELLFMSNASIDLSDTAVIIYKDIGDFKEFVLYLKAMAGNGYSCTVKLPAKAGSYTLGDYGAQDSLSDNLVLITDSSKSYSITSRSSQTYCYRVVGYR